MEMSAEYSAQTPVWITVQCGNHLFVVVDSLCPPESAPCESGGKLMSGRNEVVGRG